MTNFPRKANENEIVRVKANTQELWLINDVDLQDVAGEHKVVYTARNVDNHTVIRMFFDDDIISIVTTADRTDAFIAKRQGQALPPMIQNAGALSGEALMKRFEQLKAEKDAAAGKKTMNAPRSQWQKERDAKRKAYEYIDFLLERYNDLISMQQVMPHDTELQVEIDLIRAEFDEKTSQKVIQDGRYV